MLAMSEEKARIEEQVGRALSRGDLRQREVGTGDIDKIIALGMVGISERLADAVFRVKYANEAREYGNALQGVYGLARALDQRERWRYRRRRLWKMAKQVFNYWLMDVCPLCTGVGYEVVSGSPHLSDRACPACHGERKRMMPWLRLRMPQEPGGRRVTPERRKRWLKRCEMIGVYQKRHRALLVTLETMERVIGEKMIAKLAHAGRHP
jgi:hypothetical protein